MSFGFSIGDIIAVTQLTTRTYNNWKNACGEYANITDDLAVLKTLLKWVETEALRPNSFLAHNPEDFGDWETLSKSCRSLAHELQEILDKYKSLGTNRRRNWDRIRLGNHDLDGLSKRLVERMASLSAYVSMVGMSSQARVEKEALPKLLQRMEDIAAQMRKGTSSINTALTTYEGDDKTVWREFRRELIGMGIRSREIHKYSAVLKTYVFRLHRDGLLDEEEARERDEDSPHSQTSEGQSLHVEDESLLGSLVEEIEHDPYRGPMNEGKGRVVVQIDCWEKDDSILDALRQVFIPATN